MTAAMHTADPTSLTVSALSMGKEVCRMADQRDNRFFEAVMAAAAQDDREITETVMRSITARGLPLVFFHDQNGKPVVIESNGAHGKIKKSLKK